MSIAMRIAALAMCLALASGREEHPYASDDLDATEAKKAAENVRVACVTGATGYLGQELVGQLLERG